MRLKAVLFVIVAFGISALASWFGAKHAVSLLERETERSIASSLQAAGQDWAGTETDGLRVILTGTAPTETARFRALEVAGQIVDTNRISDTIEVRTDTTEETPEFNLRILRNGLDLSLIGIVPGREARDLILRGLLETTTEARFTDLLEAVEYVAPERWSPALDYGVEIAAQLPRSQIFITEGAVDVRAFLDASATVTALEDSLIGNAPEGVELTINLNAPKPVMAPYAFDVTYNETFRVAICAAPNTDSADAILGRLAEKSADAACDIALGAPSDRWSNAVISCIDALETLGGGRVTITDSDVALLAPTSADDATFAAAVQKLNADLPSLFSLTATKPEPEPVARPAPRATPPLRVVIDADGTLILNSPIGNDRAEEAARNYAAALFGHDQIETSFTRAERLPEGWSQRVLTAIEAISYLEQAELDMSRDSIRIKGTSRAEDTLDTITALFDGASPGTPLTHDITYVPPPPPEAAEAAAAVARAPSAEECARSLNLLTGSEQIVFAPNSADINTESSVLLNEIAKIIRTCPDATFEIGGHTDSQGREKMNLDLSQARSEAVLDALLIREVRLRQLSAKGYGESQPIADNDTEEGRATNRRIAFKLIPQADEAAAEAAETDTTTTEGETPNE